MQHVTRLSVCSLLLLGLRAPVVFSEEPQAILNRAIQAQGGAANLRRAKAVQAAVKGTVYDPGTKDSLIDGARFTGELITQLPHQVKQVLQVDTGAGPALIVHVLNGPHSWARQNEIVQPDSPEEFTEFEQSAYVDYVSSLAPLLNDPHYTLTAAGEEQVDGRPAVSIKVTSQGHPDVALFFDKESGFLLKNRYQRHDVTAKRKVVREEHFRDYQEAPPTRREEQTLTAAKIGTDDAALLEFLRRQTLSAETRSKLQTLIRNLGDPAFDVRQKAKEQLVAQGITAVPLLKQALKDPDAEVAGSAKECLQAIGKATDPATILAAVRLLALRQTAAAVDGLLDYLPSAPDETVAQEVRAALACVGFRDGKPDPALVRAANDTDPQRKATAAALVRTGGQDVPGQRLWLRGLKHSLKGTAYQDGKKVAEYEVSDIQVFNKLDDRIFAKP